MKLKKFTYKTNVQWIEAKRGLLSAPGKPNIEVATPPEFKGHQGKWTPEELFVASLNTCIMTTFLHYAEKEGLKFLSYESPGGGVLERTENGLIFSTIKITPNILVSSKDDIEKAKSLLRLSERNCLISNSLKSKVEVVSEVSAK